MHLVRMFLYLGPAFSQLVPEPQPAAPPRPAFRVLETLRLAARARQCAWIHLINPGEHLDDGILLPLSAAKNPQAGTIPTMPPCDDVKR